MTKIQELTADQASKLAAYREKWLAIGLSTEKADHKEAEKQVKLAYAAAGMKEPSVFIWLESPMRGAIAAHLLLNFKNYFGAQVRDQVRDQVGDQVRAQVGDQVRAQVWAQVWDQVGDQVRAQVRDQVGDQVRAQVWAQVWDQVGDQVWAQVWDQVRDQVGDQVRAQVGDQVRAQVGDQVRAQVGDQVWAQVRAQVRDQVRAQVGDQTGRCGYGLHDSNWLGFYEFFKNETKLECCNKLEPLIDLSKNCGWWWPFEGAVILTEKPVSIYRNDRNQLHKDGALALAYPDGWGVYALNGVRMKPEYVLTESEKIDPKIILEEKNAEVRRELIRKVGVERFIQSAGAKVLHEYQNYSLLEVRLSEEVTGKYLKMLNPSIGVWHVEGVPNDCKTVQDALHARKPKKLRDLPIDDQVGESWYQQGDVCIWPQKAKSVQRYPEVLT